MHMNITLDRMRESIRTAVLLFAIPAVLAGNASAQETPTPSITETHQHTHSAAQSIEVEYPRLGRAQVNAKASLFTLDGALQTAHENNPTLRQAESGVKAARSLSQQAGLYPNPTVGY